MNESANEESKENPQQEQIRAATNQTKVHDRHTKNLLGSLTFTSKSLFWRKSACTKLAERRTGEHHEERVG